MSDDALAIDVVLDPLPVLDVEANNKSSGSATSKVAMAMLTQGDATFRQPTRKQRRNLAMAFAAEEKILYGKAFDALRVPEDVDINLDDLQSVESNLAHLVLYEIKSTNRQNLGDDFKGYFFALTAAELLVAQSLGDQFKFLLIHTLTGHRVELSLRDLFKRARSIYPSWSVLF